jgi:hypothetical protein
VCGIHCLVEHTVYLADEGINLLIFLIRNDCRVYWNIVTYFHYLWFVVYTTPCRPDAIPLWSTDSLNASLFTLIYHLILLFMLYTTTLNLQLQFFLVSHSVPAFACNKGWVWLTFFTHLNLTFPTFLSPLHLQDLMLPSKPHSPSYLTANTFRFSPLFRFWVLIMYVSQSGRSSSNIGGNIFIWNSLLILTFPEQKSHVFQFGAI